MRIAHVAVDNQRETNLTVEKLVALLLIKLVPCLDRMHCAEATLVTRYFFPRDFRDIILA